MASTTNLITISGVVVKTNNRFVTLKSKLANGKASFIEVWGLTENVKLEQIITVLGKLALRNVIGPGQKQRMVVKAYNFWYKDEKVNLVAVVGKILSRKKLVRLPSGQDSLSFRLKLSDGNTIPVVAFDGFARSIVNNYSLDDVVKIGGVLVSREYDKVLNDKCIKMVTTEVVVDYIRKESWNI